MKMSRFIAGLDQELQVKCHESEVKTFTEAFEVASQAERARQAARLVMPVPSANVVRDVSTTQSVNSVPENDYELRKAVQTLTATVKDLSNDLGALKLKLSEQIGMHHHERYMQAPRSPSPYGRSPDGPRNAWRSGYGHSPSRYSNSQHSSPERYSPCVTHHHRDYT